MQVTLTRAVLQDAEQIYVMQLAAFKPLLDRYQDYETSPANESIDRTIERLKQPLTDYYLVNLAQSVVGAIRIRRLQENVIRVGPVCVLPQFQDQGIAQRAFALLEVLYPAAQSWVLDTILQEQGNCHLYEKLGYVRTGELVRVNDKLTLVSYIKAGSG